MIIIGIILFVEEYQMQIFWWNWISDLQESAMMFADDLGGLKKLTLKSKFK